MKFLKKSPNSTVLKENLHYVKNRSDNNKKLRNILLHEQKGFCAYTEEVLEENTLSEEVEHFNPDLKNHDNYYNYYTVSRYANQRKMKIDRQGDYNGAAFFTSLFFQDATGFKNRVTFRNGRYTTLDKDDHEARQFIEYLGFNDNPLFKKRSDAVARIQKIFERGNYSESEKLAYFRENPLELSFITALEAALQLELEGLLENK